MCKLRNNILVTVGQETGRLSSGAGTKTQGNKASTTGTFFSDSIVDFLKIHGLLQTLTVTKTALTILSENIQRCLQAKDEIIQKKKKVQTNKL